MIDKIDFENPKNVQHFELLDMYQQLLPLRDDPEAFQKAADNLRKAFLDEEKNGRFIPALRKLQAEADEIVRNSPDPMAAAAEIICKAVQSSCAGMNAIFDHVDVEVATKESIGKTRH
jgi:hypothetical protein